MQFYSTQFLKDIVQGSKHILPRWNTPKAYTYVLSVQDKYIQFHCKKILVGKRFKRTHVHPIFDQFDM